MPNFWLEKLNNIAILDKYLVTIVLGKFCNTRHCAVLSHMAISKLLILLPRDYLAMTDL
jgi:hypothetical protein